MYFIKKTEYKLAKSKLRINLVGLTGNLKNEI
jgi:hypothetical protein